MVNSLLLMAMVNKKIPKFLPWALYLGYFMVTTIGNPRFFFVNLVVYTTVMLITRKITDGKVNQVVSILSILIWSVCVDMVDYFMWPAMNFGRSLPQYVWDGIVFNYKLVFLNVAVYAAVAGLVYATKKVTALVYSKKLAGAQA